MANIDRVGSFRGKVVDRGLGETKNGFHKLVLQLEATEMWDDQNEVWVDWTPYDVREIEAHMVLFGKGKKPTFAVEQAMRTFGWDGIRVSDLGFDETLPDKAQWRVAFGTGDYADRLQVASISAYDAAPGRAMKKLSKEDAKKLDGMYAAALKAVSGGPKPKKATPTPPTAKPEPCPDPTPSATEPAVEPPAPNAPTGSSAPTKPPVPVAPKAAKKAKATDKDTAWVNVYTKGNAAGKTEIEIGQAWTAAVKAAGDDEAVGDDWSGIQTDVLKTLGL